MDNIHLTDCCKNVYEICMCMKGHGYLKNPQLTLLLCFTGTAIKGVRRQCGILVRAMALISGSVDSNP